MFSVFFLIYLTQLLGNQGAKFEFITFNDNSEIGYSFPSDASLEINRSVHFQFKTKQDDSFLFYIGSLPSQTDSHMSTNIQFISVYIEGGLFHVIISNSQSLNPSFQSRKFYCVSVYETCADDNWHNVEIRHYKNEIIIFLDKIKFEFNISQETFIKTVHLKISKATEPFEIHRRTYLQQSVPLNQFKGCMKEIYLIQNNVTLNIVEMVSKNVYNFRSNGNFKLEQCLELFPLQPITFNGKADLITISGLETNINRKISLSFRTFKSNCLIAYQSSSKNDYSNNANFYAIEIRNSRIYFSMGHDTAIISEFQSSINVSNGLIHTIEIHFQTDIVNIFLDNVKYPANISTNYINVNLSGPLYIGAISGSKAILLPHHVWSGLLGQFFSGCILSLKLDDEPVQLDLLIKKNSSLKIGCKTLDELQSVNACANQPCNSGVCQIEWDQKSCDCTKTNFTGDTCTKEATVAEFNGYQFMRIKFPFSYKSEVENLNFRFNSKLPNGLLLSTKNEISGSTDKLEIFMQNGSVYILLNFGKGNKKFKTNENCFDGKWHVLKMERRRKNLKVWIDENFYEFNNFLEMETPIIGIKYLIIGSSFDNGTDFHGSSTMISKTAINVGKIKNSENQFFMGHMMHFVYNGQNYFQLAKRMSPINIEFTASLQNANSIKQFSINFHSTKSYLVIPKINIFGDFRLEFQMKTLRPSGLVLFLQGQSNDYLILEMVNGLLHISYNWGSGYKRKISESGLLNDGQWHSVKIVRHMSKSHSFAFRVDGIPNDYRAEIPVNKGGLNFNHYGRLHLGGYMENQSIVTFDNETPRSKGGFQGCIASFYVNNSISSESTIVYKDLLREASEKYYVEENCPESQHNKDNYCYVDSCNFGGKCIQHWNKYSCDCSLTSFTGPKCEYVSTTVQFIKHPSYIVFKYSFVKSQTINQMAFGFQTNTLKSTSLVSIIGSKQMKTLLNIEIQIVNDYGFIQVDYTTEMGSHSFMETRLNVIDGLYHIVRFTREGFTAALKVDDLSERIHVPDGMQNIIPIDEELLIIVGSNSVSSKQSFQGYISGLSINDILFLDEMKDHFNSDILLINKSNVILTPNFIPRHSDRSSIFLKQSEEEAKSSENSQKTNRLIIAKPHCPGITEAEKSLCQQSHSKGIVKPSVEYRKSNKNNQDYQENTNFQESYQLTTNNPFDSQSSNYQTSSEIGNFFKNNPINKNVSKANLNINIWLIAAFSCGGALMLIALSCLIYRCSTKDEGSYNVKEDRICIQTNLNSCKLKTKVNCDEKSNQSLLSNVPNKRKSKRKRSGETKEWYV